MYWLTTECEYLNGKGQHMFEIHSIDGRSCPMLVCDVCGEGIVEAGKAAVVFGSFRDNGERVKTLFVHKGTIDGKTCHQEADAIINSGNGKAGWQELKAYLVDLAANVGFPAAQMAQFDADRNRE